jgi:hypothetical protein
MYRKNTSHPFYTACRLTIWHLISRNVIVLESSPFHGCHHKRRDQRRNECDEDVTEDEGARIKERSLARVKHLDDDQADHSRDTEKNCQPRQKTPASAQTAAAQRRPTSHSRGVSILHLTRPFHESL